MQYGVFYLSLAGVTDNAFRFCFTPDESRPLLGLEQMFFNEQRGWNGKIRTSKLFIVTDQRQSRLWRSSRNSTISSRRSTIGIKKTRRIEKLLLPPWRKSSRSLLRVTSFHLAHMCDLNVCRFSSFSDQSWDL